MGFSGIGALLNDRGGAAGAAGFGGGGGGAVVRSTGITGGAARISGAAGAC